MALDTQIQDGADSYTTRDKLLVLSLALGLGIGDWQKTANILSKSKDILSKDASEFTEAGLKQLYSQATSNGPKDGIGDDGSSTSSAIGRVREVVNRLKNQRLAEICDELEKLDAELALVKHTEEGSGTSKPADQIAAVASTDGDTAMVDSQAQGLADISDTCEQPHTSADAQATTLYTNGATDGADAKENVEKREGTTIDRFHPNQAVTDKEPETEVYSTPREMPVETEDIDMEDADALKNAQVSSSTEIRDQRPEPQGESTLLPGDESKEGVTVDISKGAAVKEAINFGKPVMEPMMGPEQARENAEVGDTVKQEVTEQDTAMAEVEDKSSAGKAEPRQEFHQSQREGREELIAVISKKEQPDQTATTAHYHHHQSHSKSTGVSSASAVITAEEQQLRNWKKNISMVWDDISGHRLGSMFISPIKSADAPNYHEVIRQPLDLKTIKNRIRDEDITTTVEFYRDIMHMLMNALMYNAEDTEVYQMAMEIIPDAQACIEQLLQTEAAVKSKPKGGAPGSGGDHVPGGSGGVVSKSEEDSAAVGSATAPMMRGRSSEELVVVVVGDESDSSVPETSSRTSTKRKRRVASERASKQLR
ncbi:hypothetical protein GGI12_002332 [Dipsacomyces acuminosporus]|nr:hypothetical protein GGI12_002332 [Dipsacomyces acuminosporus]